jgi:radical SAM-linked protein
VREPVQRLWLRIARVGKARFLSHLEAQTAWMRALRRADMPLAYSHGFHPRPLFAFSGALPVGEETVGDYLDLSLVERVDPASVPARLRGRLPEGFEVIEAREAPFAAPSLMALAEGAVYKVQLPHETKDAVREAVAALVGAEAVSLERRTKTGARRGRRALAPLDVRPMIRAAWLDEAEAVPTVHLELVTVGGKPGKPSELVPLLTPDPARARVVRVDTLRRAGDSWRSLLDEPPTGAGVGPVA